MGFQELINAFLIAAVFVLFGQVLDIWDKLDRHSEFMGELHDRITKLENENERTDRKHEDWQMKTKELTENMKKTMQALNEKNEVTE